MQDIEDVVKLGRELNTCPYYATRAAIAAAHLVVLPYQTRMHKSTREACGIEMRDNIVIIDEAHNLLVDRDVAVFYRKLVKQARKRIEACGKDEQSTQRRNAAAGNDPVVDFKHEYRTRQPEQVRHS